MGEGGDRRIARGPFKRGPLKNPSRINEAEVRPLNRGSRNRGGAAAGPTRPTARRTNGQSLGLGADAGFDAVDREEIDERVRDELLLPRHGVQVGGGGWSWRWRGGGFVGHPVRPEGRRARLLWPSLRPARAASGP